MPTAEPSPPAIVCVPSELKRAVLVRLKYNTDLLDGLREAVKSEKIKNAVILSGVGSVTRYHVHAVSNTTLLAKLAYSEHAGPMDLIAVNGYVLGGRIHAQITMTDDQGGAGSPRTAGGIQSEEVWVLCACRDDTGIAHPVGEKSRRRAFRSGLCRSRCLPVTQTLRTGLAEKSGLLSADRRATAAHYLLTWLEKCGTRGWK